MSHHTKPPYDLGPVSNSGKRLIIAPGEKPFEARIIAEVSNLVDAYFIRKACNSHDQLVSLLKEAANLAKDRAEGIYMLTTRGEARELHRRIVIGLRAAEGGNE